MDRLPQFWLWIIIGMIVVSLVTGLIFLLINKCISKNAEQYKSNSYEKRPEYYAQGSLYHPKDIEEDLPPLPPRTQFNTCPEADDYESLEELPDYVKVEEAWPPPCTHTQQAYTHTQQACTHTQQACTHTQQACTHTQQACTHTQQACTHTQQDCYDNHSASSEDYDDVGGGGACAVQDDEDYDDEDYDDVG